MKELTDILRTWAAHRGKPLALATLVRSHGSSYRRPGARMLICADGLTVGSLSGGCLEEEVAARAREVIRSGTPELLKFDTRLRFGCNGTIEVFVERVEERFLGELGAHHDDRRTCRAATIFEDGADLGSRILPAGAIPAANAFVQEVKPLIQLIIFGDGPDSSSLRIFAETLGWRTIEVEQATELPSVIDDRTAAVVKSHNYGRDFAALRHLLATPLRYVGLLGPRKRRDQLLHALLDGGVDLDAALFAPAGLDLGAETPEEIALAIVAEIQSVFADASSEPLRDRKVPIHGWNMASRRVETSAGSLRACDLLPR